MGRIALGLVLSLAIAASFGLFVHFDSGAANMWSDQEVSSVVVDSDEIGEIEEKYTPEEERAWCLYGEIREEENGTVEAVVEDVVWDSDAEGTRESVEWNCQRGISSPEGATYLGHVHSHPSGMPARPSSQDEATAHAGADVMGIYNGDELNFFAGEDISRGLDGDTEVDEIDFESRDLEEESPAT